MTMHRACISVCRLPGQLGNRGRPLTGGLLFLAGHSLGGALASLAAFDIQRHCPCLDPMDVSCYTFGAPRVGNHAFARQYDAVVPDTWNIINNQVTLQPLYARPCYCTHTHCFLCTVLFAMCA